MASPIRSVLVTGSSSGIGEAAALRLDRDGWRVVAGVRREEDGRRLAGRCSDRLRWVRLDVTDHSSIAAAAAELAAHLGEAGLDGLVNNAGIAVGGPLEYVPPDRLRRQFEVNVLGLVAVTQAFLPLLRRARGRIVNVGSVAGRVTTPLVGPYCASKHAVEALSDALRLELAPWGIEVAVIEPGMVVTPIWDKGTRDLEAAPETLPPEAIRLYGTGLTVMRRTMDRARRVGSSPDAVAGAIARALTARRPRARYLLGRDARLRLLLQQMLPRRWFDALILRALARAGAAAG